VSEPKFQLINFVLTSQFYNQSLNTQVNLWNEQFVNYSKSKTNCMPYNLQISQGHKNRKTTGHKTFLECINYRAF